MPETEIVTAHHPYDLPQWITVPVTGGSPAYPAWAAEESRPRRRETPSAPGNRSSATAWTSPWR
ncbi:divalent cation tolerance protein CutA [Streptomyces sp. NPDC002073]